DLADAASLPDKCQNLSAYLKLSSLFVGDHALVGGQNGDSQAAQNSRQLLFIYIDTKTGFGNSFQTGNDLFIFVSAVFQGDTDGSVGSLPNQIVFCDVSLIHQNIGDSYFHFRCRNIYGIMLCGICVTDS